MRIFAGGKRSGFDDEAADQIAAAFDEFGEHAKDSGVSPMLECGHDIIKGHNLPEDVLKETATRIRGYFAEG